MRTTWSFQTAGRLVFGWSAAAQLGDLVTQYGFRRVLIVTDVRLQEAGIVGQVIRSLSEAGIEAPVFDGGEAEPSLEVAAAAAQRARATSPDAILGLGGGSNLDLAKITALVHAHGGEPPDYFGFDRVPGPVTPLVAVPTTAGTGSEVSHAAVLTDKANQMKVSTLSRHLRPRLAVVDPELTLSCPPQVTADSGIDALTHAVEACTATDYDQLELAPGESCAYEGRAPISDCLAEQAIRLVGRHLVAAVRHPRERAAREGMALAATLAGMAFSNAGVALVHALEYPLGGALHCSHGAGNGLLLPFVMRFNLDTRRAQFARMAGWLGVDTRGMDESEASLRAVEAVESLKREIGIPERIRDLGGSRDQLPAFAAKAYTIKRLLTTNPRPASEADLLGVYEAAF